MTPLIGHRTGVGRFVEGLVAGLNPDTSVGIVPFAMTARGHSGVAPGQRFPLPARPARAVWERFDRPSIERWTGPLDVVHGTNYVVPPARCPRLVSIHDLTAFRYPEMCTPNVQRMPVLLRRALKQGAHVHTDSQFVADEVCDLLHVEQVRVHAIGLGIPFDADRIARARQAPKPFGGRPYVLALGTVEPRKSLPILVSAFIELATKVADVSLVIAGADGWGSDALANVLGELRADVRARIIRQLDVDNDYRDQLLVHCKLFVYPSLYEGFGFPPLEAMAAGRPVVATTAGSLPEVLGDAAVLVDPLSAEALAAAMEQVLTNTELAASLVSRGAERVRRYRWDTMATSFADLYRDLAENR